MSVIFAMGMMTGTSMDGLDVAVIETDGMDVARRVPELCRSTPFSEFDRAIIGEAVARSGSLTPDRAGWPDIVHKAETLITQAHIDAVLALQKEYPDTIGRVEVLGFHGQTIVHRPDRGFSIQLGDGAALAEATGIAVVSDFRSADLVAGGEGAPLAPVFHRALSKKVPGWPVAFVNIGGVANVTWVARDGTMKAFDTGPGNGLIDDWMSAKSNQKFDHEGRSALRGEVDMTVLHALMRHTFFRQAPPKSLDRNAFDLTSVEGLSLDDGSATLAAFTCKAIAEARGYFPEVPGVWVVCGGGRRNHALMSGLAAEVEGLVVPAEAVGLDGDTLEAEAFAYLAVRSMRALPLSFPETTGVDAPSVGGVIHHPASLRH